MHNVSLRHPDLPFFGWFFYRGLAGDGDASVHSKLPCEDDVLLCSLPRSQTKSPSAVSMCCSLSGGSQHNCRRTGKIFDFSFRRACCVTHYTLHTRWWARRSPLTPLKAALRREKALCLLSGTTLFRTIRTARQRPKPLRTLLH